MGKLEWILGLMLCSTLVFGIEEGTTRPDFGRTKYWKYHAADANDFDTSEKLDFVAKQNDVRSKLEAAYMNYMEWDEELSNKAKIIANEYKNETENIFDAVNIYFGPKKDPITVVEAWVNNIATIRENPKDNCTYQQMTDPDVKKFGCAWKHYLEGNASVPSYLVVCQYDVEYGRDDKAVVPGRPCSKCKDDAPACYRNLCISKQQCENAAFSGECECRLECEGDFAVELDKCRCVDIRELDNARIAGAEAIYLLKLSNATVSDTTTMEDMETTMMMTPGAEEKKGGSMHVFPTASHIIIGLTVSLLHCGISCMYKQQQWD